MPDLWTYPRCTAISVHDGDTLTVDVDCGLSTHRIITVRVAHIDAPELRTPAGVAARDRLITLTAGPLVITTIKDRTEKYGRMLAVIVNAAGVDCGARLIADGLAVAYEGGAR